MKKIILTLVVLLIAAPAMAVVTISCDVNSSNGVTVSFVAPGGSLGNRVRAFSLDVSVPAGDTISNAGNFNAGWWVYPGNIVIAGGVVTNYGSPVVASTANTMTVEMGSLYASNDPCAAHQGPPTQNGTVLTFDLTPAGTSSTVSIAKNTQRGGVVMEDASDSGWSSCSCCILDASAVRADICSTTYGLPDGQVTKEDFFWLSNYFGQVCGADASCLRADICSTTYGPPDGQVTKEDFFWLSNYFGLSTCKP